jgi:hypothetical protein
MSVTITNDITEITGQESNRVAQSPEKTLATPATCNPDNKSIDTNKRLFSNEENSFKKNQFLPIVYNSPLGPNKDLIDPRLHDLLKTTKSDDSVMDTKGSTYISMYNPRSRWNISKLTEFWNGYCDIVYEGNGNYCIAEIAEEYMPIIAECTLKFNQSEINDPNISIYDDDFLLAIAYCYQQAIKDILQISETQRELICVILTSEQYWIDDDEYVIIQFRIQFPYCKTYYKVQNENIRNRVIQFLRIYNVMARLKVKPVNDWVDIIKYITPSDPILLYRSSDRIYKPKMVLEHIYGPITPDHIAINTGPSLELWQVFTPENHHYVQEGLIKRGIFEENHSYEYWLPLFLSIHYSNVRTFLIDKYKDIGQPPKCKTQKSSSFNESVPEDLQSEFGCSIEVFYRLKADNDGILKHCNESSFIVGRDYIKDKDIGKCYIAFPDWGKFGRWLLSHKQKNIYDQLCYYELIRGDQPQKLRFDIDISSSSCPKGEDLGKFSTLVVDIICSSIVKCFNNLYPDKVKDLSLDNILIMTSHSDVKKSFHLVIPDYYVDNNKEAGFFYNEVLKECKQSNFNISSDLWDKLLDGSVYKDNQLFRILYCTKKGANRHKVVCPEWTRSDGKIIKFIPFSTAPIKYDGEINELVWLEMSLITCTTSSKGLKCKITQDTQRSASFVKNKKEGIDEQLNTDFSNMSKEILWKFLDILKESRYTEYQEWFSIMAALHNFNGDEFLDLAHRFSQKSKTKYNPDQLDHLWGQLSNMENGYTIATILKYAKDDNSEEYERIYSEWKPKIFKPKVESVNSIGYQDLSNCNSDDLWFRAVTDPDNEDASARLFCFYARSFCKIIDEDINVYIFNFTTKLWEAGRLAKLASLFKTIISPAVEGQITQYENAINNASDDKKDKLEKGLKLWKTYATKVGKTQFQSNVARQCLTYLYDPKFKDRLDPITNIRYQFAFYPDKVLIFEIKDSNKTPSGYELHISIEDRTLNHYCSKQFGFPLNLEADWRNDKVLMKLFKDYFVMDRNPEKPNELTYDRFNYFFSVFGSGLLNNYKQVFLIINGPPGSAKSTLINAIKQTFGDLFGTAAKSAFVKDKNSHRSGTGLAPDLTALFDKIFISVPELLEGEHLDYDRINSMNGDDEVSARECKGRIITNTRNKFLIFVVNEPPNQITNVGTQRRCLSFFTEREFKEAKDFDPNNPNHRRKDTLLVKAMSNLTDYQKACIFNLILDGAKRIVHDDTFIFPSEIQENLNEIKLKGDPLLAFIKEDLEEIPGATSGVSAKVLLTWYISWLNSERRSTDKKYDSYISFSRTVSNSPYSLKYFEDKHKKVKLFPYRSKTWDLYSAK